MNHRRTSAVRHLPRIDAELLAAFENHSLPLDQWTHRAHVRVAYIYASTHDLETATIRIREAIKAYNKATDTPESIDRGYHETITLAFMLLVFSANARTGPHVSSDEFCEAHPELLTKFVLSDYYSRDLLMSWQANAEFISPDLAPLPLVADAVATRKFETFEAMQWGTCCLRCDSST